MLLGFISLPLSLGFGFSASTLAFSAWSLSLWASSSCFFRTANCSLGAASWLLAPRANFLWLSTCLSAPSRAESALFRACSPAVSFFLNRRCCFQQQPRFAQQQLSFSSPYPIADRGSWSSHRAWTYFGQPWNKNKGISITPNKEYRCICLVVMSLKKGGGEEREKQQERISTYHA